jgi:ABC-type multidrug transport system fused ATPase/permease subunit
MQGRTVFVIAHRLSTVRHASRIIVMDSGRLVEQGTHEQLLGGDGLYRKLYQNQRSPA